MRYNKNNMKIIFAQGNPGKEYAHTRHNVGFLLIDTIAAGHHAEFIKKSKFHADIAETSIGGEKVLFVKPTTFYNETGQAARLLIDFYKIDPATDFLVIHDDLALPLGTIRTRQKGSDAGNNGIKSLNAHLGPDYARIRVGIFNEKRNLVHDADFVLGNLTLHEKNILVALAEHTEHFINSFIQNNFKATKVTLPLE
jgi:PTH1 family peptidyl-tRNA hydrolase